MKEYLLLLRGGKLQSDKTEAENNAELQAWGAYMGGLSQKGQLSGGLPLVTGGKTVSKSAAVANAVTSEKEISGYLIVKAETLDEAAAIAKDCPHIANEGDI
ncbi:MAG: YciI family protein, partial [Chitinophagales bacterium]